MESLTQKALKVHIESLQNDAALVKKLKDLTVSREDYISILKNYGLTNQTAIMAAELPFVLFKNARAGEIQIDVFYKGHILKFLYLPNGQDQEQDLDSTFQLVNVSIEDNLSNLNIDVDLYSIIKQNGMALIMDENRGNSIEIPVKFMDYIDNIAEQLIEQLTEH